MNARSQMDCLTDQEYSSVLMETCITETFIKIRDKVRAALSARTVIDMKVSGMIIKFTELGLLLAYGATYIMDSLRIMLYKDGESLRCRMVIHMKANGKMGCAKVKGFTFSKKVKNI